LKTRWSECALLLQIVVLFETVIANNVEEKIAIGGLSLFR
jgi:hypothetical protein